MIHLAVCTYSMSRWQREHGKSLLHVIDCLAEQGVTAIEFSGIDKTDPAKVLRRAATLRKRCEKHGLNIIGYCVGAELLRDPRPQAQAITNVKRHVDIAQTLGVPVMRHDITHGDFTALKKHTGPTTFNAALKIVIPAIREIADYAATRNIKTSLENHGFYCQAPNRVEKIITKVNHPNFGLTMDTGNFLCVNADPVAAVKQLVKYAFHIHVKDFHIKPKKSAPTTGWIHTPTSIAIRGAITGHGQVDIPAQLKLIRQAGYDGYLSLEFEGLEAPVFAVNEGLSYLEREMKKLKMSS